MKNIVLFRLTDDDAIWLADLEAGTVERTDAFEAGESDSSEMRGVDLAIATTSRADAPSHRFFPSPDVRAQGVDMAIATSARADAPSHRFFPSPDVQVQGVDMAIATAARSDAPSHRFFPSP